jgi:hypothetical protein
VAADRLLSAALAAHFGGGLHDFVLFVAPIGIFFLNRRIR